MHEKTSREIVEQLFLSKKAIDKYRITILQKINEKTSMGIVLYAIKNGLFTIDELDDQFLKEAFPMNVRKFNGSVPLYLI